MLPHLTYCVSISVGVAVHDSTSIDSNSQDRPTRTIAFDSLKRSSTAPKLETNVPTSPTRTRFPDIVTGVRTSTTIL